MSVLNFSGHQRKEDLIAVGNDRTWGYELYQALVLSEEGRPLGAAVTELRNSAGILSSHSAGSCPLLTIWSKPSDPLTLSRSCSPTGPWSICATARLTTWHC